MKSLAPFCVLLAEAAVVWSQSTWCNKNYMAGQPIVPPGGQFPIPLQSSQPLLAFRCAPAIRPYLAEDASGSIIIDTTITHTQVDGAVPIKATGHSAELSVAVAVNGHTLARDTVPLNSTAYELQISLAGLKAQKDAFSVACTAVSSNGQTFHAKTSLQRLPSPSTGGVTKMDLRTGAMLVKSSSGAWDSVFPLGFYTSFDNYIASNLSILNDIKSRGFTIVHPVPTFGNLTALNQVLDRMEELGLFLMYDMRFTYMNLTSVTEQVNMIRGRKNLLLWYTGDEPDGTSDPLNATKIVYDLINDLDGYHPVSLVLNCQDYEFAAYTNGADVVMQDAYPIAINATFSVRWNTPCTPDFGDCGCDNCIGDFSDISTRMDEFAERLNVLGWSSTKTIWAVPQAFGGSEYWSRPPTGNEWLVESILSINHGATGIVPWMDPNPEDVRQAATDLAQALPTIKSFLFDPTKKFNAFSKNRIDVGIWEVGSRSLVLATNLNNASGVISLSGQVPASSKVTQILNSGGSFSGHGQLSLDGFGSIALALAGRSGSWNAADRARNAPQKLFSVSRAAQDL